MDVPRSIPINEEVDRDLKNQGIFHLMILFPRSRYFKDDGILSKEWRLVLLSLVPQKTKEKD